MALVESEGNPSQALHRLIPPKSHDWIEIEIMRSAGLEDEQILNLTDLK